MSERPSERDSRLREIGFDPDRLADERDVERMFETSGEEQKAVVRALLRYRHPDSLAVGSPVPELVLHPLDGGEPVPLRRLHRERPLVLFFGSYSCPPFRRRAGELQRIFDQLEDRAAFFVVYLAEAHPEDGWVGKSNVTERVLIRQHTTLAERFGAARRCASELELTIPMVVDGMEDAASRAFSAWPERIYVLGIDGRIVYQGGHGPYDVRPQEARAELERLLAP